MRRRVAGIAIAGVIAGAMALCCLPPEFATRSKVDVRLPGARVQPQSRFAPICKPAAGQSHMTQIPFGRQVPATAGIASCPVPAPVHAEAVRLDPTDLPDCELGRQLDSLQPAARQVAMRRLGETPLYEHGLRWLKLARDGNLICLDPPDPSCLAAATQAEFGFGAVSKSAASGGIDGPATARAKAGLAPMGDTFTLHSRPTSTHKLYLDFDGHTTTGHPVWNDTYGVDPIVSAAFDPSEDGAAFNVSELETIQYMWQVISEEFAPFDVDVTTEEPAESELARSSPSDNYFGQRVVITPSYEWVGSVGGVACVGSFGGAANDPCFLFSVFHGGVRDWSVALAHEVGHTLVLHHMGPDYYGGHASATGGWGPLMGMPYGVSVSTWSCGDYYGADNTEDQLQMIADVVGYWPDDYGNTFPTATALASGPDVQIAGCVGAPNDVDVFSLALTSGVVNLTVNPSDAGPHPYSYANLDTVVILQDAGGEVIASNNPADQMWACLSNIAVRGGTGGWFVSVKATGVGDPMADPPSGYTSYGILGRYTITGSISTVQEIGPAVSNDGGALGLGAKSASLRGVLATGGCADVNIYWGATDGGTVESAWDHCLNIGAVADGGFSGTATGPYFGVPCYYRCYASNSTGQAWAGASTVFYAGRPAGLAVSNAAASGVTATSAVLNAVLYGTDSVFEVRAYWGATDGGTNAASWQGQAVIGTYTDAVGVALSCHVRLTDPCFRYTFRAGNAVETLWASQSAGGGPQGADVDGDYMPDAWETLNFGGDSVAGGGATNDWDGDGYPNLAEYTAGTSPTNGTNLFAVVINAPSGVCAVSFGTVRADGTGYSGLARHYALEYATEMPGSWTSVLSFADIEGTNQRVVFTNILPGNAFYYRGKAWLRSQ